MLRRTHCFPIAAACLVSAAALAADVKPLEEMVQSERRFSATSVEKGMREAFVEFLAEGGVLFRPLPVDGKKLWSSRDSVPGTLIWEPSFAQVSASGDFGYTTGPWEFRPSGPSSGAGVSYGHFISVWQKQSDGSWRVTADIGIQHDPPERGVGSGDLTLGAELSARKGRAGAADVAALDQRLSDRSFARGIGPAFAEAATEDFLLNRDGFLPTRGPAPARASFDSLKGGLRFESRGTGVAASQDLAFSYGITRWHAGPAAAAADSGVYLHVWRREGGHRWKLALAVENPL